MRIDENKIIELAKEFNVETDEDLEILIDSIRTNIKPIILSNQMHCDLDDIKNGFMDIIKDLHVLIDKFRDKFGLIITQVINYDKSIHISYVNEIDKSTDIIISSDGKVEVGDELALRLKYDDLLYLRNGELFKDTHLDERTIVYSMYLYLKDLLQYLL